MEQMLNLGFLGGVVIGLVAGLIVGFIICHCCCHENDDALRVIANLRDEKDQQVKRNNVQVLFFPDSRLPCKSFYSRLKGHRSFCHNGDNCEYIHYDQKFKSSLVKIFKALNEAKSSIDLCMFIITFYDFSSFLIYLMKKGVKVRIITDTGCKEDTKNDQIPRLRQEGIPIKTDLARDGTLMHNKFVIIDDEKVIHGSMNWTHNAIMKNHEACTIDSHPAKVKTFAKKFDNLWSTLKDLPQ